jgi:23S rRNA pseudouridine2605 synthase
VRHSVERTDWLARALARAGVMPEREAEAAIRAGRVTLQGRVVREPLALVRSGDLVRVDGHSVSLSAQTIVLAFHKPPGVITARSDPEGRKTVFDLLVPSLPPELAGYGWHAVGRLDRDTTGLLFFTNDERFVSHATLPKTHLSKRYVAEVRGEADAEKLRPLEIGIPLQDGPARPAKAKVRGPGVVEITLIEGRNRQVKRMLSAVKLPVKKLHREAIGEIVLDVPEGKWRRLSDVEIRSLGFAPNQTS